MFLFFFFFFFFNDTATTEIYTLSLHDALPICPSADILAAFSSIGPPLLQVPGVGVGQPQDKIKPDVVAPGVNVYSSIPSFGCASPPCFAFFQGTSMATPHVAGSAALLIQLHPNW